MILILKKLKKKNLGGLGGGGWGVGDGGLGPTPNPQSPIPNPHYNIIITTDNNLNKFNNKKFNFKSKN